MSVQVSTHVDEATKRQFDRVCEGIGTTPSDALSMFIKGVINHNGKPFHMVIPAEIPEETPEEELEDLGNSPDLSEAERKQRLRKLYGSCNDPTMVEPPDVPREYEAPRRYDLI